MAEHSARQLQARSLRSRRRSSTAEQCRISLQIGDKGSTCVAESCICSKNQSTKIMRNILQSQSIEPKGAVRRIGGCPGRILTSACQRGRVLARRCIYLSADSKARDFV